MVNITGGREKEEKQPPLSLSPSGEVLDSPCWKWDILGHGGRGQGTRKFSLVALGPYSTDRPSVLGGGGVAYSPAHSIFFAHRERWQWRWGERTFLTMYSDVRNIH